MKKSKEPTFVGAKEIYFERLLKKYNIEADIRESVVEEMCWVDIDSRASINFTIMRILTELYSQDELKTLLRDIAKRKLIKKNQNKLYKHTIMKPLIMMKSKIQSDIVIPLRIY